MSLFGWFLVYFRGVKHGNGVEAQRRELYMADEHP